MAAFHFTAKIHSRAKGASAVRAAAYRAAERLEDIRAGRVEDYTRKGGVIETAILMPEVAPTWTRQELWQAVEAYEIRKDAQLAQELEINLPRELDDAENWRLVTDFARERLVGYGRVCDVAFHKGRAGDGGEHPHAHILMPLREIGPDGFGKKHPDCDWRNFLDRRDVLGELREDWATFARVRAAELGVDLGPEWDHRSFADRGIELEGQPKLGPEAQGLERAGTAARRTAEILEARQRNGEKLLADPSIALAVLTQRQSTFTERDLAVHVFRHSDDTQYPQIMAKARAMAIGVGHDRHGQARFSTRAMIELEARMVADATLLAGRIDHALSERQAQRAVAGGRLSEEQADAARHLLTSGNVACLIGYAGAGKSTLLQEARQAWEAQGYRVRGAALSGIAAENLQRGSGLKDARTIASLDYAWERGRDRLEKNDVLVIDEAGMIGSRDLAKLTAEAKRTGAKLVLVGDAEQLQAIEAGAAFRTISERIGAATLTDVRRQLDPWQREATRELATGRTAAALDRYRAAGNIVTVETAEEARAAVIAGWAADRAADPFKSRIMLAHTNDDVDALNRAARETARAAGDIGEQDIALDTNRGSRSFAIGDRVLFRRNDRELGVRNGTLGKVDEIASGRMAATLDDGSKIELDPSVYRDLDHGYAVTIHKAQGVTVDRAHVLATRGFDRHLAYVACSRHRERLQFVASREAFGDDKELARLLSRERAKDTTLDYREEWPTQIVTPFDDPAPRPTRDFIEAHRPQPRNLDELISQLRKMRLAGPQRPEQIFRDRDEGLER